MNKKRSIKRVLIIVPLLVIFIGVTGISMVSSIISKKSQCLNGFIVPIKRQIEVI